MKKMFCLLLALCMISTVAVGEELYTIIDALEYDDLVVLQAYVTEKIEDIDNAKEPAAVVETRLSADRADQALVGEPVYIAEDNFVLTVEYAFHGTYADALAKSFNSYNTRYGMEKGQEWVLVYLKLEGQGAANEKIDLSDWNFHIVDENGVDCGTSYIADNPKQIRDMYGDSVQYAWYGLPVAKDAKVSMIYQSNIYNAESQYWFDLSARYPVDTTNAVYPEIKLKSKDELVFDIQMRLGEYGYMVYAPSGIYDTNTQNAMKKFQKKVDMKMTGLADEETLKILFTGNELPE